MVIRMKKIALLGSTGSIGTQTLDCCRRLGIGVNALAANKRTERLEAQAREFCPRCVVVSDKSAYSDLKQRLADTNIRVLSGMEGLCEAAALEENDVVCNALVGMVGLRPTLAAIAAKKTLALANKETLVAAGQLVMGEGEKNGVSILPVDSEHSAIFQCLQGSPRQRLRKVLLTASGGPFRGKTKEALEAVTLAEALRHPNWSMGPKITVDSATMMNKGLECIEAMWLFHIAPEQIEVVIHPQSVIHSAVEYCDGAVIAQLGVPDMAIPIQYALTYPDRAPTDSGCLSLTEYGKLTFEKPDLETFVCLRSCLEAAKRGGLAPCAMNSANEQAVALFLDGKISFVEIGRLVERILADMDYIKYENSYTLEQVLHLDSEIRGKVLEYCGVRAEYYNNAY